MFSLDKPNSEEEEEHQPPHADGSLSMPMKVASTMLVVQPKSPPGTLLVDGKMLPFTCGLIMH
jgi:hypothetical protein